jgi:GH24 family phage-related lysozyme (muramidase)
MNIKQLREQLEIDEGVKYVIYLDHLGLPTFGIGHLVTKTDPENGQMVGTGVSKERVAISLKNYLKRYNKS